MADGCAKMRLLLFNNDPTETSVKLVYPAHFLMQFQNVYAMVFGDLFPTQFIYAKKYEALTVLKQFQPEFLYDKQILDARPDLIEQNAFFLSKHREKQSDCGVETIISDNRIPKTGFYTVDKQIMQRMKIEFTKESLLKELFLSEYINSFLPKKEELA